MSSLMLFRAITDTSLDPAAHREKLGVPRRGERRRPPEHLVSSDKKTSVDVKPVVPDPS